MMPGFVSVTFQTVGKVYYYDPAGLELKAGQPVVAETARGTELGKVVAWQELPPEAAGEVPTRLTRLATDEDLTSHYRYRLRAAEALRMARERVNAHQLPMKLLDAEFTLDGNRVVFYFSAEGRVDFRELVRDLASNLRKRIELHQIGARDRAKNTGGLGPCGRECCCSSWLREFSPVSIKMTKEQGLSLNPSKISGSCGRLMCCLRYEYETYRQLRRELPPVGTVLRLPEGNATVVAVHLARYTLTVEHPDLGVFEVPAGRSLVGDAARLCPSCTSRPCEVEAESEGTSRTPGPARQAVERAGSRRPGRERQESREGPPREPDRRTESLERGLESPERRPAAAGRPQASERRTGPTARVHGERRPANPDRRSGPEEQAVSGAVPSEERTGPRLREELPAEPPREGVRKKRPRRSTDQPPPPRDSEGIGIPSQEAQEACRESVRDGEQQQPGGSLS